MKKIFTAIFLFMLGATLAFGGMSCGEGKCGAGMMSDSQKACHDCMKANDGDKSKCMEDCKKMKKEGKTMSCGEGKCGAGMAAPKQAPKCGGTMSNN